MKTKKCYVVLERYRIDGKWQAWRPVGVARYKKEIHPWHAIYTDLNGVIWLEKTTIEAKLPKE